ncbi:MAG TPA: hypothetical protein VF817_00990 [Patescibacteria group bacterium]
MEKVNIFFDLFGVITSEGYFATNVFYPIVKDRIPYDLFKKKYLLYCLGNISDEDFWEGIEIDNDRDLIWENVLSATLLNDDICQLIKDFKDKHDLHIASEAPAVWAEEIIRRGNINDCFRAKFYSSDLKITKPFSGFYAKILESVSGNRKNIFIDDTLVNLDKVSLFGSETIYFNQNDIQSGTVSHKKVINSKELREILCNL